MRKYLIMGVILSIEFGPIAHAAPWNGPAEFECGILFRDPDVRMEDPVYKYKIGIERRDSQYSISTTTLSGKEVSRFDQYNALNSAISWKKRIITWAGVDRMDKTRLIGGNLKVIEGRWYYHEVFAKIVDGVEKERSEMLAGCAPQDGD